MGLILLTADGTDASLTAARTAVDLLGSHHDFHAVAVDEPLAIPIAPLPLGAGAVSATTAAEIREQDTLRARSAVEEVARAVDVDVTTHVVVGAAADAIAELATSLGADLLVLAPHDRSFLERLFHPSVSEDLRKDPPCPLLLVRGVGDG